MPNRRTRRRSVLNNRRSGSAGNQLNNIAIEDPFVPSGTGLSASTPAACTTSTCVAPPIGTSGWKGSVSPREYDHAADWEYKADYFGLSSFPLWLSRRPRLPEFPRPGHGGCHKGSGGLTSSSRPSRRPGGIERPPCALRSPGARNPHGPNQSSSVVPVLRGKEKPRSVPVRVMCLL